ncbi:MAG: precorrin-2 C(20)-methyltransferase, partial [Deltaproteobacteria bacterium]|nr:precorrin-2 C(20)-methyltransferase [Deltaproteobacteria bacterium]
MNAKLYIVGIGPGDPDMITLKAVKLLERIDHVFVPISAPGRQSVALKITRAHIPESTPVTELVFPMIKDPAELLDHYRENYAHISTVLSTGASAALLTLGDPATYSTAWPIFDLARQDLPQDRIEIISGVTSFSYCAARAATKLAERNEIFTVVSAYDSPERIEAAIDTSDTVVFLKTYKKRNDLIDLLKKKNVADRCVYLKRCGL